MQLGIIENNTQELKKLNIIEVGNLLGLDINENNKCICVNPEHDEANPSMTLYEDSNLAYCFGCQLTLNSIQLVEYVNNCSFKDATKWLERHKDRLYNYNNIETKSKPVIKQKELSTELPYIFQQNLTIEDINYLIKVRGFNEESIFRFCIGKRGNRFTIPIYENNKLLNFKLYAPNDENNKMIYFKSNKSFYLYGKDDLIERDCNEVIISEGETDRIILEQLGFCSVTSTSGAGSFKKDWLDLFNGRIVYIFFDKDKAGTIGAEKIYNLLKDRTLYIGIIKIPEQYPEKTDVTDLYVKYGWKKHNFDNLLKESILT